MNFFQIKVYQKNFLIFISVLLVVCMLFTTTTIAWVYYRYIENHSNVSQDAFNQMEQTTKRCLSDIDSYVESVYSNPKLLLDFLYFFGNSPQTYFTQRLLNVPAEDSNQSFLKDCKNFVNRNRNVISQIGFYTKNSSNVIEYHRDGSSNYLFDVSSNLLLEQDNVSLGYLYEKNLPSPLNAETQLGKIQFVIDSAQLFSSVGGYKVENAYLMSNGSSMALTASESSVESRADMQAIYASGKHRGTLKKGPFHTVYYNVYPSERYGYSLVTAIDAQTILQNNMVLFVLLMVAGLLIFVGMTAIIAFRMNCDAKYLNGIMAFINVMKTGDFRQQKIKQRNDEYSMIAGALNDMADKIQQYIEREYLFQLRQQKAEMLALENQINPHFLYNTLEIIRSKAYCNGDAVVSNAIYNLGNMYRDIVKSEHVISISEELGILTSYLKLMEFKHDNNFYYQITVCPSLQKMETVKFWMQPLAENFFSHGFDKQNEYNLILIVGEEQKDCFTLEFVDNGVSIDEELLSKLNESFQPAENYNESAANGIGMRNVYLRLRYFYGEKLSMEVENNAEAGITVRIIIKKDVMPEK